MGKNREIERDKAEAFTFIQKINYILSKMRETNVGMMETKPNTDPSKKTISRVLFPPEGGILTCYDGLNHPSKGFCYGETVETVDEVKKTLMIFTRGFYESLRRSKVKGFLLILFFKKQFMSLLLDLLCGLDYRMSRVRQKPERYCRCGREIYKVFNKMAIWYPKMADMLKNIRNIICMILEFDDAYRYPFQHTMVEFNRDAGRRDIVGEIERLLDFTIQRDSRGPGEKFKKIKKLLFLLRLNKNLKDAVKRFFLEIDLNEIKMDEDDIFHAKFKDGYNFNNYEKEKK